MKSSFKIAAMVVVVGVLCGAVVAQATDFVWDANTADTSWLTPANWDLDSSYPQNFNDNATIDAAGNLCTFDPGSPVTINDLTLGGESPTKRKLHLKDGALTVGGALTLTDYAELDLDQAFTVNGDTGLSGSIWIDQTAADMDVAGVFIDGETTALLLTQDATSCFCATTLTIDAEAANAARRFELGGGTISLGSGSPLTMKSDTDAPDGRAKLWLRSGEIEFGPTSQFIMVGGDTSAKRVELDLDQNMDVQRPGGITTMTGYVFVDVATGKQFNTSQLVIVGPGVLKVRAGVGAGLFASTGETS